MRLVLATRNPHKVREFQTLMAPHEIVALPDDVTLPPETGSTFTENALRKARTAARATGRPSFADDSGIEALALDGAPGVYSARYAGPNASDQENLDKLLSQAPPGSPLRYVCVIAYVDPVAGAEHTFEGTCEGTLTEQPRGDGGFGYDPAFLPDDGPPGLTMAELSQADKDAISHRGRAARELLEWLSE